MTATAQTDLFNGPALKARGTSSVLEHLGPETVQSVNNVILVVASSGSSFTWEQIEAKLPAGILLRLREVTNASGALMVNAAKLFHFDRCGYRPAENPTARGRPLTLWKIRGGR